jgi:hypothetical protein
MIARYRSLAERLRSELEEIGQTQAAVQRHWHRFRSSAADQDAYLNSVAFNLHSLYCGLERMFELIAIELDGGTLGGERWHSELLNQMALDLPQVRPPVLTKAVVTHLDEYRKFRHLVRNVYATNLDPDRMEALVASLPAIWNQVCQDLSTFIQFLEQLAHADEG